MKHKPKKPEIWWMVSLTFKKALTLNGLCPDTQAIVKANTKITYKGKKKCISDV